MNCPIDGTELLMTHRNNIEIDYCPKCRGVWLDRGELDKLIERAAAEMRRYDDDDDDDWDDDDYREDSYDKPKRDYRYEQMNQPQSSKPKRDYRYGKQREDDNRNHKNRRRKSKTRSILEEVFDFLD